MELNENKTDYLPSSKVAVDATNKNDLEVINHLKDNNSIDNSSNKMQNSSAKSTPTKKSPKDYVFGALIGEGSFSSVYLAKEVENSMEFAIKVCNKQHIIREKKTENIRREKEVMAILSGNRNEKAPFFVKLYATFQDHARLYFVMTYASEGEILTHLKKVGSFSIECSKFYIGEILQAIRHLHKLNIVHRDLKPENILLNDNKHILITDFGSAKVLLTKEETENKEKEETENKEKEEQEDIDKKEYERRRRNSFVGTAQYVSPEVLKGNYIGPESDLWALGCILYQFITGQCPFQAPTEYLIFQKILKLECEFLPILNEDSKDLIKNLLKIEPSERLGATDELPYSSIHNHKFLKDINLDSLHEQIPPDIFTSSDNNNKKIKDKNVHSIPDHYEPGFNAAIIAERVLKSDGFDSSDFSDEDEDQLENEDSLSENLKNLNIVGSEGSSSSKSIGNRQSSANSETSFFCSTNNTNLIPESNEERMNRLKEQEKSNPWHKLAKGKLILKQGLVNKKKGFFSRRRMLLLTEGPHLLYCEPNSLTIKGEIPWSSNLKPEPKDFRVFFIHTPNRTYYLEDAESNALEWCNAINTLRSNLEK